MNDLMQRLKAALADRYTIEGELGQGGMATVYLAEDVKHRRKVAVKVMHPALAQAIGPDRFLREIETTADLRHPHILPLYDSGDADGFLFYVMPYAEGETLRHRLDREKQLPIEDAVDIAREIADALSYAHSRDVIHRDIKPENILLEAGHAVVADFGIAKAMSAPGATQLTATGVTVGTPAYMSPEQAGGTGDVDGRSDVYSLGCVLYEMLGGQPPFVGPTADSVVRQHMAVDAPPITSLRPDVPDQVAGASARALAKTPADRFHSAAQFGEEMRHAATPRAAVAPATTKTGFRLPYGIVAALVLAVLVLVGGWLLDTGNTTGSVPRVVVLPFENLGAAEDEYFADGMTEEITTRLATLPDLAVIARASANTYKGASKTLAQIGEELRVDYILTGSVRWQRIADTAQQVRVTPQLVRVEDQRQLWAEAYGGDASRVFEVQADIADRVRSSLNIALRPGSQPVGSEVPPTDDLEAYVLFLRANSALDEAATAPLRDYRPAIDLYEQAVGIDAGFARAWARLGYAHMLAHWFGTPGDNYLAEARRAVSRAFELDPSLPDARLARGYVRYYGSRDYTGALEEFRAAREAKPGDADLLEAIGLVQRRLGDWEGAADLQLRAVALDPHSSLKAMNAAGTLAWLRRFDDAHAYFNLAVDIEPRALQAYLFDALIWLGQGEQAMADEVVKSGLAATGIEAEQVLAAWSTDSDSWLFARALYSLEPMREALHDFSRAAQTHLTAYHLIKGQTFELSGNADRARAHYDSAYVPARAEVTQAPEDALARSRLAMALAGSGQTDRAILEGQRAIELLPISRDALDGARLLWVLASIYVKAGEFDAALDQYEAVLEMPSEVSRGWLRIDPGLKPLRETARFQRLVDNDR